MILYPSISVCPSPWQSHLGHTAVLQPSSPGRVPASGRQLGSPSVALKTCYPPGSIHIAYGPDPQSKAPLVSPQVKTGGLYTCFISMSLWHSASCIRALKICTQINETEETARNNHFLISSQTASLLGSLRVKQLYSAVRRCPSLVGTEFKNLGKDFICGRTPARVGKL